MKETSIEWINNLRFIAVLLVILVHVSVEAQKLVQFWSVEILYGSLARASVPLFVMISGALLFRKPIELFSFLRKKMWRIVVPLIFWSLVYSLLKLLANKTDAPVANFQDAVYWVFLKLATGSSYHLWYMYMIIGLYLFIPIIAKWVQHASEKEIIYFLIIWVASLLMTVPIEIRYFSGYLGYLILGKYLSDKDLYLPSSLFLVLFLLGYSFTAFGTYFTSLKDGLYSHVYYQFLSLNVALSSAGIFLVVKYYAGAQHHLYLSIRDFINMYSYGIYLVHLLALHLLSRIGITWDMIHPIGGIPLVCCMCLVLSTLIVYTTDAIPIFGKYISGKA